MSDQNGQTELNPESFTNRELSTIDFNRRVLSLAEDKSLPLLERLKYVAIVGSNLDEFFMVRVAAQLQKIALGVTRARPDGHTPTELMPEIRQRITLLMRDQRDIMAALFHELKAYDVRVLKVSELETLQEEAIRAYFYDEVFPVLTPLAADHARPFPFISNLSLNLGVYVRREDDADSPLDFVRIKVPPALPRLVDLSRVLTKYAQVEYNRPHFVWIEDVIAENLDLLFPGMDVVEHHPFRVTRNADIDYESEQDDDLHDLSTIIEASVRDRRFGSIVRLSVQSTISNTMLDRLIHEMDIDAERDVYMVEGALGSANLFELMAVNIPELKFPPYVPRLPEALPQGKDIFKAIKESDILVHHPYDSFAPVEEFFRAAAHDPAVIAIKATLYRVGKNSPIVRELLEARENGKQVAVLVELKARFDEENNLEWARALEQNGVHVTYGVEKLHVKTHSKIALVIRKEATRLKRYVHLGTGNYNASTARLYADLGIFTDDEDLTEDAMRLFNRLTGYAPKTTYKRLLVAPEYLHNTFLRLIDNEIEAAKQGKPAHLIFKMNQLEEDVVIQRLYDASKAGVKIDLIIRGLCCLRAGVPGLSENIRVRSILGRFLEHARIYYFHNAPEEQKLYAGSADLMRRNLYNRVETVFPVLEPRLRRKMLRILATDLRGNSRTWEMQPDGTYALLSPSPGEAAINSQEIFMQDSAGLEFEQLFEQNQASSATEEAATPAEDPQSVEV